MSNPYSYHPLNSLARRCYSAVKRWWRRRSKLLLFFVWLPLLFLVVFSFVFYVVFYPAPREFPVGKVVTITRGQTLSEIAEKLEEKGVVSSAFWLEHSVRFFNDDTEILAGKYFFKERKTIIEIARAIGTGGFQPELVKITIPEGATVAQMAIIFNNKLKDFDKEEFISEALSREGFLFPDTYFFPPNSEEDKMVSTMRDNFSNKIEEIKGLIEDSPHSLKEIVIMASLLEKEAFKYENKRIIAGILWKRLEIGMPLQVDAAFDYINNKTTFELTHKDLNIDSPYNTYRYKGLPKGPIASPGMESLRAAADPVETKYLYYLSDMKSNVHFSETFEQHKRKKRKYLN